MRGYYSSVFNGKINCLINSTEAANYSVTPVLAASRINIRSASALRGSLYFIRLSELLRQFAICIVQSS